MKLWNSLILCAVFLSLQGCVKNQSAPELSDETITQMNSQNANNPMLNSSYMFRSPSGAAAAGAVAGARGGR